MVVKHFTTLTISAGNVLTTDQPCRGLLIYVQGDCTINGTLSMTARGPSANPTVAGASDGNAVDSNGLRFPFKKTGSTSTLSSAATLLNGCGTAARTAIANHRTLSGNGIIATIPRVGATGPADIPSGGGYAVTNGNSGSGGQTGSGGSGARSTGGMYAGAGGGGTGSCFAGGAGGGGSAHAGSSVGASPSGRGSDYGGAGGYATAYTGSSNGNGHTAGGGAGNPGGIGSGQTGLDSRAIGNATDIPGVTGSTGCGGLIVLIVGGNLVVNGSIVANGSNGGPKGNRTEDGSGGGGSGGGSILIAYRGTFTNNGTIQANGGAGGTIPQGSGQVGGTGGNGSVQTIQIL